MMAWLKEALTEEIIALAFKKLRERINEQARRSEAEVPQLERQAKAVEGKISRLAEAIMSSEEPPPGSR